MLECEQARVEAHALLTRGAAAAAAMSQPRVLSRLPVTPFPPPDRTCERSKEAATRLVGLVRSWWPPSPAGISSEVSSPSASSEFRSEVAVERSSKSCFAVAGTFSRPLQPPAASVPPLQHAITISPTRSATAARDDQLNAFVVHRQDNPSTRKTDVGTGCTRSLTSTTTTRRDSEKEDGCHREPKSLRTTKTLAFSVESLLAR